MGGEGGLDLEGVALGGEAGQLGPEEEPAPDAAAIDGDNVAWGYQYLFTRAYTLGGGTSEISRNAIGERILGLPRDAGR